MSHGRTVVTALALLVALAWTPVAEAQAPIRTGATLARTGVFATEGQRQFRGYQLCVKHVSDKGGVLGPKLELLVYDDEADPGTAVRLYDKLIAQDKVELVLGPYRSVITDAVADVTEKHKMLMVASLAGTTSLYRKGRKFIFSVYPYPEVSFEGLIDLAAQKGLKTVALISSDDVGGRAGAQGTIELARKRGLQVVIADAFPPGTTDFSTILTRVRAANPDVLARSPGASRMWRPWFAS